MRKRLWQKKYNAIIALAAPFIGSKGNLDPQTKERVDKAIQLFSEDYSNKIIMSSGYLYNPENIDSSFASATESYAIEKGISRKDILLEEMSKETVGGVVFTKGLYLVPNNWRRVVIVPGDYHLYRSLQIFNFILGDKFNVEAVPSFTANLVERKCLDKELNSLEIFFQTFSKIKRGDDRNIHSRLIESHPVYKGRRDLLEGLVLDK